MPALSAANTSKSRAESDSFTGGNGAASDASDSSWDETPEFHWQSSSDDEEGERRAVVAAMVWMRSTQAVVGTCRGNAALALQTHRV
jgi:hypothetical protein